MLPQNVILPVRGNLFIGADSVSERAKLIPDFRDRIGVCQIWACAWDRVKMFVVVFDQDGGLPFLDKKEDGLFLSVGFGLVSVLKALSSAKLCSRTRRQEEW